jgi:transposase
MAKRRKFSEEFKREAVQLTYQPGASVSQVARDIGVGSNLLFRSRRELKGEGRPSRARVWLAIRSCWR